MRLRREIKLFVFFVCTAGFFYHTWTFLQLYLAYPTMQDVSEEYPDTFNAPAITICNKNRLLRQPYCKTYPEKCTWKHTTWETFCDMYSRMCPKSKPSNFIFGIPEFTNLRDQNNSNEVLNALGPQEESDFISYSYFGMIPYRCSIIQVPKNGFPYKCFSLLSLLGKQHAEPFKLTFTDELIIALNMHPEEYMNNNDLVPVSVVIHDPRKLVNPLTDGITLSAGKHYQLYATMEKRESLPPPYNSRCVDYLKEWKKNGGYGPLSKKAGFKF